MVLGMCAQRETNVNSLLEAAQIAVQDADRIAELGELAAGYAEAESVLQELASVFFESTASYPAGGMTRLLKLASLQKLRFPIWRRSIAPWLSRFPPLCSWPTWTRGSARLT